MACAGLSRGIVAHGLLSLAVPSTAKRFQPVGVPTLAGPALQLRADEGGKQHLDDPIEAAFLQFQQATYHVTKDLAAHSKPSSRAATASDSMKAWVQKMSIGLFPEYLRVGPWHPIASASLMVLVLGLMASCPIAFGFVGSAKGKAGDNDGLERGRPLPTPRALRVVRAVGASWGTCLLALSYYEYGWWPMVAFTMQSWALMTVRYFLGMIDVYDEGCSSLTGWRRAVSRLNEALRFPCLVQNSITVIVWWLVLVPIIWIQYCTDANRRAGFYNFNMSFNLLNFHLFNLPLAAVDHLLCPRRLLPSDLWLAVAFATAYVLFYLSHLDPQGIHLYIFLSPRTKLLFMSLASIVACYIGLHRVWDKAAQLALQYRSRALEIEPAVARA